jgi:cyclohexyl-isocyanide hydratase
MQNKPFQIGILIFPQMTQLDMTGPFEVFARIPNTKVHVIWKNTEPVLTETALKILPTVSMQECPDLDLICIPGGPGQVDLMEDDEVIDFVRRQGKNARYVTSVCTGALVLGAAGLLDGYKATTHWASMDNLPLFGATPVTTRVCIDRNRITGGGISAGLDFGLTLAGILTDDETAAGIELSLEYTPQPPYGAGSPDTAPKNVVDKISATIAPLLARRKAASMRAAARMKARASTP